MTNKKRNLSETATTIVIDGDEAVSEVEEGTDSLDFHANLQEIRRRSGVIGYILKDADSATIDLDVSAETAEHAMLASQAFDSYAEIKVPLNLGDVETIVVECRDLKMLCIAAGESTVSIFMKRDVDHAELQRKLAFQPE